MIEGENQILKKTLSLCNITVQWDNVKSEIDKIIREESLNVPVPGELKFSIFLTKKRFEIKDQETKNKAKAERKFKIEQHLQFEPMRQVWKYIEHMHWKVQNSIFFWFIVFVYQQPYEKKILTLFEKCKIRQIHSRASCIKFFGEFSRFFKFLKHFKGLREYPNYISQ